MISLPELNFQLREWKPQDFQVTKRATAKIRDIGSGAGTGSNRFIMARNRLHKAALAGGLAHLITQMRESVDARALSDLLCTEVDFVESIVVTRELLDQMASVRSPMSRLALTQLIRAFFVHFDQIATDEDLDDWCQFLKLQLRQYRLAGGESELRNYARNADLLFQKHAPQKVVQSALDAEIDFDTLIQRYGLTGFSDGRYLTLCRYQYYLQTLKDIDVGEAHSVLKEVCNEDVVNAPFSKGKLLGHAVLETLIDRTAGASISKAWQSTILNIAGDPRVPKTHPSYQKWWTILGEKRIALMRGWLSRLDLKVFLKILEQSARDGSNTDMERMFVSRKKFMEGLLNQGHVVESRLFLSDEAVRYLNRNYRKSELPSFARVASTKTSMIYLNIANKVHMIEGSHSFRLKLMDKLPSTANVTDYGVNRFRDGDFRTSIASRYYREFGGGDGLLELTHDIHLNWQYKAIKYLKAKRIEVETGKMIARDRLREYKRKYGSY
jgi:EH_Signature domain